MAFRASLESRYFDSISQLKEGRKKASSSFSTTALTIQQSGDTPRSRFEEGEGRKRSNRARRWNQVMHERMREERKRRDRCTFGDIFRDGDTELAA